MKDEDTLFVVTVEQAQYEAERLFRRRLSSMELHSVKKGLEWGLGWDLDVILKTAVETAVQDTKHTRWMRKWLKINPIT